ANERRADPRRRHVLRRCRDAATKPGDRLRDLEKGRWRPEINVQEKSTRDAQRKRARGRGRRPGRDHDIRSENARYAIASPSRLQITASEDVAAGDVRSSMSVP